MQRQCTLTQVQHIMLEEEWDGKIPAEFPAIEFQPTTRDNYATCITNRGERIKKVTIFLIFITLSALPY